MASPRQYLPGAKPSARPGITAADQRSSALDRFELQGGLLGIPLDLLCDAASLGMGARLDLAARQKKNLLEIRLEPGQEVAIEVLPLQAASVHDLHGQDMPGMGIPSCGLTGESWARSCKLRSCVRCVSVLVPTSVPRAWTLGLSVWSGTRPIIGSSCSLMAMDTSMYARSVPPKAAAWPEERGDCRSTADAGWLAQPANARTENATTTAMSLIGR